MWCPSEGGDGDVAITCREMSGQFLSEAIQAKPVSEARVSETRCYESRGRLSPGTRPRNHEGVTVGQSSASADESVSARNRPQQTRSSCASVEGRNLAHVVPVEGWARFCNVKTLEEWARCADSGSPQEDRSKTVDRFIRREILPRRSPKEAPRKESVMVAYASKNETVRMCRPS